MIPQDLLDILVCPFCRHALTPTPSHDALDCLACRRRYPVEDGIPILLIDRAQTLA